jgi:metallo-beta-lactamase class B
MKVLLKTLLTITTSIIFLFAGAQSQKAFKPEVVYQSDKLVITRIAEHSYQHTSYKQTNDFGNVPCNGLIVRSKDEAIVFDTPTNDSASDILIGWISQTLHARIKAIIPTHFHDDCLGGLKAFHQRSIPSYAYVKTIALAGTNNYEVPKNSFTDSLLLPLGDQRVLVKFFGEGHTIDNVVGYYPADKVLFGGCLIKEMQASKGYLGDANLKDWSATVDKIRKAYPQVQLVVPGHGAPGNKKLLDYTISLFKPQ